jgi:hypothetical protein
VRHSTIAQYVTTDLARFAKPMFAVACMKFRRASLFKWSAKAPSARLSGRTRVRRREANDERPSGVPRLWKIFAKEGCSMKLGLVLAPIIFVATPVFAAAPPSEVTVALSPVGGSQQRGTALVTQSGNTLTVTLKMPTPAGQKMAENGQPMMMKTGPLAAHIHRGHCPNPQPQPLYALKPITSGSSTTTLTNTNLSTLTAGDYAIVVHSAANPQKMIACGDLKQANPTGTTTQ